MVSQNLLVFLNVIKFSIAFSVMLFSVKPMYEMWNFLSKGFYSITESGSEYGIFTFVMIHATFLNALYFTVRFGYRLMEIIF